MDACSSSYVALLNVALWKHSVVSVNSKESFSFFPSSFVLLPSSLKKGLSSQKQFSSWVYETKRTNEKCLGIIKIISIFFLSWPWNFVVAPWVVPCMCVEIIVVKFYFMKQFNVDSRMMEWLEENNERRRGHIKENLIFSSSLLPLSGLASLFSYSLFYIAM